MTEEMIEGAFAILIRNGNDNNLYFNWASDGTPFVKTDVNQEDGESLKARLKGGLHPFGTYRDRVKRPLNDYEWKVQGDEAVALCEMLVPRKDFRSLPGRRYEFACNIIARAKAKKAS